MKIPVALLPGILFVAASLVRASPPYDIPPLNPASPNYSHVFSSVQIGSTTPTTGGAEGAEILSAVYAYLCPNSPVYGNTAYRDRLLVLLDDRLGLWAANSDLADNAVDWESAYAYMLMNYYKPSDLSPARASTYATGIANNNAHVITADPLLYSNQLVANDWLNGEINNAMSAYFGSVALNDATTATIAQNLIDTVMTQDDLADGGTHYVGFCGESPTYHMASVSGMIWWWKITGSTAMKTAIDGTRLYSMLQREPSGYCEYSSSIPYKHYYNGLWSDGAALYKAYLYNDGYNYFYGAAFETATSNDILNAVLYQPSLITKPCPSNVGVLFDGNIQGPRGRFGTWGWIATARDPQHGGPENNVLIQSQGYQGRQCGKDTFVGAFALGTYAHGSSLAGALDNVVVEAKTSTGTETDFNRGSLYRFLTQDEQTATITRKNFGSISSVYTLSTRTSSNASVSWGTGTTWQGQQLWVLTDERAIGLVQIVATATSTAYGLDARLVYCGGRYNVMGSYYPLTQPTPSSFGFGQLATLIQQSTFTGTITSQRFGIQNGVGDNYSALVRLNDAAINVTTDTAVTYPAGTRRWAILDTTANGTSFCSSALNALPEDKTWAVLSFTEGNRVVYAVQNLTATAQIYSNTVNVGTAYSQTSMHRSWNSATTPLTMTNGTVSVAEIVPAFGHMIIVSSNQPDDQNNSFNNSATIYPSIAAAPTNLAATQGGAAVTLTWTPSTGATGYNVKRGGTTGGPYTTTGTATTGSYSDTGVTAGSTYYYVVTATNAGGESLSSNQASITVLSPFQQWLAANGYATTVSPSSTPDNDGVPLFLKWATGVVPGTPSAAGPASISSRGDFLTLQFNRLTPAPVNYLVESSPDLVSWSALATLAAGTSTWTGTGSVTESGSGPVLVSVTDTASLSGGTGPRFLRLRATTSTDTTELGTVPMGDLPVTIGGGATAATSLPLDNAPLARNAVQAVASSTLTVVNAGSWATASVPCALRLLSGNGSGRTFLITAQSGNALGLNSDGVDLTQLVAVGDLYEILPLDTFSSLFGATAPQFGTGGSAGLADDFYIWNGTTFQVYFNNGASWRQSGSLLNQNNTILPLGGGALIAHRGAAAVKYQLIGRVPEVALSQYTAPGGTTFVGGAYPLPGTFGATGFATAPGWLSGSSGGLADDIYLWNGTTFLVYYYNGTNWRQAGSLLNQNATPLPAGTPLMIQRRSSPAPLSSFINQPLPYTP